MDGLRGRDLIDGSGHVTDAGRACRERIEAVTDRLAVAPYEGVTTHELDRLIADLEPLAEVLRTIVPS